MTTLDFKNETFGFPVKGESGFKDAKYLYGKEYKGVDMKAAFLKHCFKTDEDLIKRNVLEKLWKEAKDLEDFKNKLLEDELAINTQFAFRWLGVDFSNDEYEWLHQDRRFVYKILESSEKSFQAVVKNRFVKLSSNSNDIFLDVMYNGIIEVAIFEDENRDFYFDPYTHHFKQKMIIDGKISIIDEKENTIEINGKYKVLTGPGYLVFHKWGNCWELAGENIEDFDI